MSINSLVEKEIEYFSSVSEKIINLLQNEKINITEGLFNKLLDFLSGACAYEEEGVKIKPNLLVGYNIHRILEAVTSKYKMIIFEDDINGTNFNKKIKALIPFCKNDWKIYINIKTSSVEYGIFRSFNGLRGLNLNELIFNDYKFAKEVDDSGIVSVEIINNHEIQIIGLLGNNLTIDFSLIQSKSQNIDEYIDKLVFDATSNALLGKQDKHDLRTVFIKIFKAAYKKLHGTICLVVKSEYKFPNQTLSDGIWLDKPINLSDIAVELLTSTCDNIMYEKYYSLTGVLIEMLNIDGITVIDDRGYIRGYNVFINQSKIDTNKVVGGARRRAFQNLLNSKDPLFLGAYFQSQDGYVCYERVNVNE